LVPTVRAICRSVALQAAIKHGPTTPAERPHWQVMSVGAQLAAAMAERRQDVWLWGQSGGLEWVEGRTAQAGSPLRFWAAAMLNTAVIARTENFIL